MLSQNGQNDDLDMTQLMGPKWDTSWVRQAPGKYVLLTLIPGHVDPEWVRTPWTRNRVNSDQDTVWAALHGIGAYSKSTYDGRCHV